MFEEMTYEELELRCGRFYLSDQQTKDNIKLWHRIMSNVLVVRCEYHFESRNLEYVALSPLFVKKSPMRESPWYEFKINEYNDLEAVRCDD